MISFYSSISEFNFLNFIRQRLESIEITNPHLAHTLCKMIPARCPFAREVKIFERTLFRIPPLCKLNPFYEQIVSLRFKCLCYLANECGEDITVYC
ncbi:Mo-dependent nitrogenase C-terminal domain-containing protein [Nostoc sp. FACHB-152]|uniref:Mo-dependent nitrogenase C-terminal domain-containing protein n=1 Tax=unclassified Nostoc TaxID=2593658 RepID=UPI00168698AD|nr:MULTISPECIES: Mo-dependent nitrogenase C-terminal domain-containing protein [unclassified Nostoc]MBD2451785.1 Mo-dependent nitrogenase C-terminal domain-containing protein [Nostoc sp. FACHB-152]MBD2472884.1 Mo-dependent nitrogenase C-terminal domain-containing protein [Nostoc sp. FACHB-145]